MSYTLVLDKEGLISTKKWVYDEETEKGSYVIKPIRNAILSFLGNKIEELEDGYTLRSYFKMITEYPQLQLLDQYFQDYLDEYKKCPETGCVSENIEHLSLARFVCVDTEDKMKDGGVEPWICFDGEGKDEEGADIKYAVEYTPLNKLLDIPLKIGNFEVILEHHKLIDGQRTYKSTKYSSNDYMSLFDFVHEIIWELSFTGSPKERDESCEKLFKRCEDVINERVELKPWSDKEL
jgi:hypothetical protein